MIPRSEPQARYVSLQRWEGAVLEIRADSILARLADRTEAADVEAEILLDEISKDDLTLLRPGAVFYWNIGYRDDGGHRELVSSIRFRRLPAFSLQDIQRARDEARRDVKELFRRKS